ncbi:MAG: lysozyme inhibitor LprI family protein [Reyranella sp.]|nr:lysozyme inhibitor LprI family protein [Reyranella sp.]
MKTNSCPLSVKDIKVRALSVFVGALGVLIFYASAHSEDSHDYKADEKRILDCVETAERSRDRTYVDLTRECIGKETNNCDLTTEHNTYESNRRMFCAGAEAQVWMALMERAYEQLLGYYAKWDREQSGLQTGMQYEPVQPAVEKAHEAWLASKEAHCDLVRIHAGIGTDRYDAPARCNLYDLAERALLYRRWLTSGVR